ncbi:MAG: hypothetical protein WEB30_18265 [Cyclobacteriaceae bacterium]
MNHIYKESAFSTIKKAHGRKLIINPSLRIYYFNAMPLAPKNNWSISREG